VFKNKVIGEVHQTGPGASTSLNGEAKSLVHCLLIVWQSLLGTMDRSVWRHLRAKQIFWVTTCLGLICFYYHSSCFITRLYNSVMHSLHWNITATIAKLLPILKKVENQCQIYISLHKNGSLHVVRFQLSSPIFGYLIYKRQAILDWVLSYLWKAISSSKISARVKYSLRYFDLIHKCEWTLNIWVEVIAMCKKAETFELSICFCQK